MLSGRTPFFVGLVVLLGIGAFVFAFGSLNKSVSEKDTYAVYGVFDDATGLVAKSRVMLSGIPIGQIESVSLDAEDPSKARVTLRILRSVQLKRGALDSATGRWVNGATLVRKQASLLGDYYVAVSPGISGPLIGDGERIFNVVAATGLGALMDRLEKSATQIFPKLEKITDDIQSITGAINSVLGSEKGAKKISEITDAVAVTTKNVAEISTDLRVFMRESIFPEGKTISGIIKNVAATAKSLKTVVSRSSLKLGRILANVELITGDVSRFVRKQTGQAVGSKSGTLSSTLEKLDENMTVLKGTLDNVKSVTGKIDKGKGTIGRLINDSRLINRFEEVVGEVNKFTRRFNQLQIDIDFRTEYLFGQASMKHYVSLYVRPRQDKYYFFQVVDDPRGRVDISKRVTTTNDPSKPAILMEETVETRTGLKFTAQFAKKWHFLTFRYGIMESTGGWGLDVDLLQDALRFKLDVFDFSLERLPRIRLLAAWEFVRHIYIAAGIDDIVNAAGRDYYIGLGVSFTDGDLKSVLPILGSAL